MTKLKAIPSELTVIEVSYKIVLQFQHLRSDRHSDFTAKADEHFSSVDQVISSLPTLAAVITTAKERRSFQNQRRAKNRSNSVE